ncbi:NAD(P)-dependent dehydrogenase (short-subunit alcohol dehydrogenase family) [Rhodococcus sp. PvR044]|uniref:SDR family NAD(P)-dependent oxidoreductase n=1 Tax=Rhodococcus TaxID=1827 RepID=UPI000BC53B07|nr:MULTISPECIES: SDR family NAD(P)-dependent oxidoreductase [Rhodococcus]MBP1161101.1 NAD(P)-dependent dehydrogenase (short-subunit alcohol dehydrogenase family) [Rhodococcus sp. PvR099]MCZ4557564.1 SDR family NAD(P)-dependent oxidoreductase [Rhodococcus maanshanensis]PTR39495.1 short-subunit dehydrogenase [Rhodococcus sp. OK611]SNX92646.1 Short-chain dehydrogenase [Rhodococcus sp. OK270]
MSRFDDRPAGRTAVVTGAASGIGAALAAELGSRGMSVVVADIDGDGAQRVAEGLRARGVRALGVRVDVADPESVENLVRASYDAFGSVELLCNNAGVLLLGDLVDSSIGDWRWLSAVNVEGMLNCLYAFLPRMRRQTGWRHVMNTSSTHAFLPDPGFTALYSAAKHAILGLTLGLRSELAAEDIGVTALCPGQAATRILDSQRNRPTEFGRPATEPFGTEIIPMAIEPEDVARLAVEGILRNEPIVFALPEHSHDQFRQQVQDLWRLADNAIAAQNVS